MTDARASRTRRPRGKSLAVVIDDVLRLLAKNPGGCSKHELVVRVGDTTAVTVRRALDQLKEEAAVEYRLATKRWILVKSSNALRQIPDVDDINAAMMARAMLGPYADDATLTRIDRIIEQLDERRREAGRDGASVARDTITATVTMTRKVDPATLWRVSKACRRHVLAIKYRKAREAEVSRRVIEPWVLRAHDGIYYVRAFDRSSGEPRTFVVAQIEYVTKVPAAGKPRAKVPRPSERWGDGPDGYGIDHDRPDTAVIVVRPPLSRWLAGIIWSDRQTDRWLPGEHLERTVHYHSCREFARRVLSVLDGVVSISPPALREQVEAAITAYRGSRPRSAGEEAAG